MRKILSVLIISVLFSNSSYCQTGTFSLPKPYFVPPKGVPRNIIIILANGMGMNQVASATLKKGAPLSFSNFPVTGFTQPWQQNGNEPTDSNTALAVLTSEMQKHDPKLAARS